MYVMSYYTCTSNVAEHDQLFYLAYERVKVDEGRLEPHLWSFRSRITVDHLRSSLMQQKKVSVKILDAFLQDVSSNSNNFVHN